MHFVFSIINRFKRCQAGFSLIEAAIVLAIMGCIMGYGLPLWSQFQLKQRQIQCQKNIKLINKVLGQYFLMHKCLPCPSLTQSLDDNDGVAPPTCLNVSQAIGTVPFKTLGIPKSLALDSANHPLIYAVHPHFSIKKSYKNYNYEDDIYEIIVKTDRVKDEINIKDNPIIYILLASNGSHTDLSTAEQQNLEKTFIFYDLPYSINPLTKFRQVVSWIRLDIFIALYGHGLLLRNQLSKDTLSNQGKAPLNNHEETLNPPVLNSVLKPDVVLKDMPTPHLPSQSMDHPPEIYDGDTGYDG